MAEAQATPRRVSLLISLLAALCAAVLTVTIVTDVHAHQRLGGERSALQSSTARLATLRHDLALKRFATALATNHHSALETSITSTLGELSTTNAALQATTTHASLQGFSISTLQTCLGGVQRALGDIAATDNAKAAADISAVSGPCTLLAGRSSAGLVYPFDFADPDVIAVGNTFYAYATNSVAGNIQIIESSDLTHWTVVGSALPTLPPWAVPHFTWAPSVTALGGAFRLYYAADVAGKGTECISVATSARPQGPFVDSSTAPLVCQLGQGGSIDPSVFVDHDGGVYLLWKSGGSGGSAKIWSEQLDAGGTKVLAGARPAQMLSPDQGWESGTVEAPDLVAASGRYLLFFSGNDWNSTHYAVGFATCTGPLGPCSDAGARPILPSGPGAVGPGGESVFADARGSDWIAFHAWVPGAVGFPNSRGLYVRRLDLSGAVPVVGPAP